MNDCKFIGRFIEDPKLKIVEKENGHTTTTRFWISIPRVFKKKDTGKISKQETILQFEAWDTGAEAIVGRFSKNSWIILYCYAKTLTIDGDDVIFRVEKFDSLDVYKV